MFVAIMMMAILLDSHPVVDPTSLVKQLGSSRYALRVAAEGELARLGRAALPALQAGKDSKDAEIRTRSRALIAQIENALVLEASPIQFDFQDLPISQAIDVFAQQAGQRVLIDPEERPNLSTRRITARSDHPIPFWTALDVLSDAGGVHSILEDPVDGSRTERTLLLRNGKVADDGLVSDRGAFRVRLTSVHHQSEIQLEQRRTTEEFFLQFLLSAEPRLSITRDGSVKLTEATDDRGQSLLNPSRFHHEAGYFGLSPSSLLRFRVDLDYPESPARTIKTLRGTIPVIVASRKSDPLVIRLNDSKGKLVRNDEVALSLLDHRPASTNQPSTVQVAIRAMNASDEPINPGKGEPLGYRPESFQQQIEILDADGRPLSWFPSSTLYDGEETRLTLTIGNQAGKAAPLTLRYYGILRVKTDVAFEFRAIPLP